MSSILDSDNAKHKWKGIRAKILKRDGGLCVSCSARATQVDHITPRMMGGDDTYTNLQSLCGRCHKAKTKADNQRVRTIMANHDTVSGQAVASLRPSRSGTDETMQDTIATPPVKPSWRGWQHAAMFPVVLIAGVVLVATAPTSAGRVSSAIFASTALLLFGVSALLHRGSWSTNVEAILRRLDHANIYLIIAGTYTPFAVLALPQSSGKLLLSIVWTGALVGVVLTVFWIGVPRWLSTSLYVVVGWVVVFFLPELVDEVGLGVVALIAIGGVLYTLGAVVYATKWPNPSEHTFGFHEVFHLLTIAAFTAHYIAVWIVVHQ